jgi:voltage-gated potassium channel
VGTLFYAAVSSVELVVEGTIRGYFGRRRMEAAISKLSGHYILCGYSRVGQQVAREFALDGVPFVIIEQDPETVAECVEEGYLVLLGEASDDVLEKAGIRRAKGLVAAVDSDADNVFVVLSARKLNPKLHIVARASSDESAAKLEIAGADRTLSLTPLAEGDSLATHPLIVDFLDVVTRGEKGIDSGRGPAPWSLPPATRRAGSTPHPRPRTRSPPATPSSFSALASRLHALND